MQRREFVTMLLASSSLAARADTGRSGGASSTHDADASVDHWRAQMRDGRITSVQLTQRMLDRIHAIDRAGPTLNAVIELNPQALELAEQLDRERRAGHVRGALHGIPVLIKDNIATGDRMLTTAGSLALTHGPAKRDAHIVARLRDAGAVILGKTNLSEWANIRSTRSTSGWSARGGLTRNPYALDRNTSGSSSGSGAAGAAALAVVTVGTETDGSIVSPSSINGLVGLKPTVGLVSRAGIIPISHTQDTAGPMTRSVADAAVLLTALAGADPDDPATQVPDRPAPIDYVQALKADALRGARLGIVRTSFTNVDRIDAVIEREFDVLRRLGAVLIDNVELPSTDKYGNAELDVLLTELKAGLPRYLAAYAPDAPIKTLADVMAFNERQADREMPYFSQELFVQAQAKPGLDNPDYRASLALCAKFARDEGIDAVIKQHGLDALIAPTGSVAWLTDYVQGDHSGASFSTPAAVAGYPHITVPAGQVFGLPIGLSFVGAKWSEASLLAYAYAYEQATHHRVAPAFAHHAKV